MRAHTLLAAVAIASLVSCTGLISPSTQAKIDQASTKYQDATGISTGQTVSLLGKWWMDLQAAREVNRLLKAEPIPLGPIQATQASPLMDYTSAKAVLEGINPQASATPSDGQRSGEGDTHPERQSPKAPAPRSRLPKPRVNQESSAQMLASLGRHGPDRHPAAPGDQQPLATEPQLPAPAIIVPIILHGHGESPASLFPERAGHQVPHAWQSRTPGLPTSAVLGIKVIGADDLPAL